MGMKVEFIRYAARCLNAIQGTVQVICSADSFLHYFSSSRQSQLVLGD